MGQNDVMDVFFIPGYERIVTLSQGLPFGIVIWVFGRDRPKLVFDHYEAIIAGIVLLFDDVISSLDRTGRIISWHTVAIGGNRQYTSCEN